MLLLCLLPVKHGAGDVHSLRSELADAKAQLRVARAVESSVGSPAVGGLRTGRVLGASATGATARGRTTPGRGWVVASERVDEAEQRLAEVTTELGHVIARVRHASTLTGILAQVSSLMVPPRDPDTAGRLQAPVRGVVTSGFGPRRVPSWGEHGMHDGIDIFALEGTPVSAAADGVVTFVGYRADSGLTVVLDHGRDEEGRRLHTAYSHLSATSVQEGDRVAVGEEVGAVGSTGRHSTGPHLHFEVRLEGEAVDPRAYL